ncbi:LmeA family phospholipid-binding protein [Mycolicibacterium grossiae]|uniref:LmeA family phospholipid-binding protein n=1 Tax=Mycolicibacterium grossiae TaxID=1552759 RepID=UPI002E23FFB8
MTVPPQRPGEPDWRGRRPPPPPGRQPPPGPARPPQPPGPPRPPGPPVPPQRQPPRQPPPPQRQPPPPPQRQPPRQPPPPQRQPPPPRPGPRPAPPPPASRRPEPPTEQLRAPRRPVDAASTEKLPKPPSPADAQPTQQLQRPEPLVPPPSDGDGAGDRPRKARFFNRKTSALLALIVVALLAGGLAGGELYARHRADGILVAVAECVVEDGATISFGVNPPFLWQHVTGHYTNITVTTAGDRVQSADGMTADVTLEDVRLRETDDAKGTIGSLRATLTWKSAGIKDTVAANLPGVGNLITGVRTDPAAGTIILDAGADNGVTAKPVVANGDLQLQVLDVKGPLPKDTVQSALDDLTKKLNDNYPLGIHADSVEVTDAGVVGTFSSQDASIPKADENPCFDRL